MKEKDRKVMVCDKCLKASCWYGEFMCDESQMAGTTVRTVAELEALGYEHPSYWSRDKFNEVYGTPTPSF